MLVYYRTYYTCIHNTHKNMGIHQETIEKLHNIVKGFRVGDVVTSKTVRPAQPYVSFLLSRGYLVRSRRGMYRVLRSMTTQDIAGVIELYNLSQNKRRVAPEKKSSGADITERVRRKRQDIVDAVYDKVKSLRDGDSVLVNSLSTSGIMRKRLFKAKLVRRRDPRSLIAGCEWIGGVVTKEDLAAVMFGKRRPYKRRATRFSDTAKANITSKRQGFRPLVDTALEALDSAMKANGNGAHSPDAPLTIESNGFRITLDKGSITISK